MNSTDKKIFFLSTSLSLKSKPIAGLKIKCKPVVGLNQKNCHLFSGRDTLTQGQTILTVGQHTDHIKIGDHLSRHSLLTQYFLFFSTAHFLKPFFERQPQLSKHIYIFSNVQAEPKNAKELALAYAPKPTHHPDTTRVYFKRKTGEQRY